MEPLDEGRSRLVIKRQLFPMGLAGRLVWSLLLSPLLNRVINRRLQMTRKALAGGWPPGPSLRVA